MVARSDQTGALENWDVALGAAVVTDEALSSGVGSVPNPTTNAGSDAWFIYERLFGTQAIDVNGAIQHVSTKIDSKAARKVEDGFDLAVVVENPLATGVSVTTFVRVLLKLH